MYFYDFTLKGEWIKAVSGKKNSWKNSGLQDYG